MAAVLLLRCGVRGGRRALREVRARAAGGLPGSALGGGRRAAVRAFGGLPFWRGWGRKEGECCCGADRRPAVLGARSRPEPGGRCTAAR